MSTDSAAAPLEPHNLEAEQAVLGSILLNRDAIIPIAPWIKPAYFFLGKHGEIMDAMLTLYHRRTPPDVQTVADELRRRGRLEAVGGVVYLAQLVDGVPTSYHIEYYARIVERTGLRRQLIAAGGRIAALGYDDRGELDDTLQQAMLSVTDIAQARAGEDFVPIGAVVDHLYEHYSAISDGRVEKTGLQTGYHDLDALTGGLQRSDMITLAARPGVGKTAWIMSLAYNIGMRRDAVVGIFSLEMNREQLVQRLLAMETGIDSQRLRNGTLRADELERVIGGMGKLAELPIFIEDKAGLSIVDVLTRARRLQAWQGLDLVIVDYLQLLHGRRQENRVQEVSEITRGLKELARELNVPLVALSQLSRAVEGRTSHIPMLSDLRESGTIEQDSDIVMFLYREELYDPNTEKRGITELHIAKHRNGPLGVVPFRFSPKTTRFENMTYRGPDGY